MATSIDFYIGIDIGTTHTKAVVATADGHVVKIFKEGYASSQPRVSWHEQDPQLVLQAYRTVMRSAGVEVLKQGGRIRSIGFSSAMHSLIPVNREGTALYPMITWADTRSADISSALKDTDAGKLIYEHTGTPVHPMSPLCKIAWIRQHEPALFKATHKFISIKEYIWFTLFNEFVVDHSIASATGLFDVFAKEWYGPALSFAGIDASRLSTPVPVSYSATADGVEYVIGASDGALANLGSGASGPHDAALTIGTSGAVRMMRSRPFTDPKGRLFNYIADDNHYLIGGAINNGGVTVQWFVDTFNPGEDPGAIGSLIQAADTVPPGSDGLVFLPYLLGERAPVWDPMARGVFFGINPLHTRVHFLRAVIEGICFSLLRIMDALEEQEKQISLVHASGGFTASPVWLQILCDILQKPLNVTDDADASAMGAIYTAMKKAGIALPQQDRHPVEVAAAGGDAGYFQPGTRPSPAYARNYGVFCRLYDKLKDEFAVPQG